MSVYLLFESNHYDAAGGARDCTGVFDTLEQAKAGFKPYYHPEDGSGPSIRDHAHIAVIEGHKLKIIAEAKGETRIYSNEDPNLERTEANHDEWRMVREEGEAQ